MRRRRSRLPGVLLAILAAGGATAGRAAAEEPPAAKRVLFVGNSLTYWNDLPELVEALSRAGGPPVLVCRAVVGGGFSLEDHWAKGDALRAIREGGAEVVVLQQGPSASAEGRSSLLRGARLFAGEIRRAGGVPALYMVWPSVDRRGDFDGVRDSYRQAAADVGGIFLPAGEAWRIAWAKDPRLDLYSSDGLHPAPAGSYLAALVLVAGLTGRSPVGLPAAVTLPSGRKIEIPEARARLLKESAAEAIERFGRAGGSARRGRG